MFAVAWKYRYSHAGGDPKVLSIKPQWRSEACVESLFGEAPAIVLHLEIRGNNCEVVCTDPCNSCWVRARGLDALRDSPEKLVTHLAAEGVVNGLKAIDIHDRDGKPALRASGCITLVVECE